MRRTILILLLGVLAFAVTPLQAAQRNTGKFPYPTNTIAVDTVTWKASGTVPGSWVSVDTLIAGTLNDTSVAVDIGGAKFVSALFYTRGKTDNTNFIVTPAVGVGDSATYWRSLAGTFSIASTKGAAVGQTADTYRDTTLWVLHYPTTGDTLILGAIGTSKKIVNSNDNIITGAIRFLRFQVDPGAASGDSTYVHCIVTKVY